MRKQKYLFLLMVLFLFFIPPYMSDSQEIGGEDTVSIETRYQQFLEQRETDRRLAYEEAMYDSLITKPSVQWLLNGFIETQIQLESSGNQAAVSPVGARGIAQFMPDTWNYLIEIEVLPHWFDIESENHQRIAQLAYLDLLYNLSWELPRDRKALTAAAYNAGPNRVSTIVERHGKAWKQYLPRETKKYLENLKPYV